MSKLNDRQREAIEYLDGPLLVLAGAGSGKTRVITHKIAYLINRCGYNPVNIAAVTFTNKAAREMKQRAGQLMDAKASRGLKISTFHTLGLGIVREELKTLGLRPGFSIFDAGDTQGLLREILRRSQQDELTDQVQARISAWKSELVTPETALSTAADSSLQAHARVYAEYVRHLQAYNAVDFDDLIAMPAMLFRRDPEALQRWQYRLRYLLVDEYQDTNASQYQILKMLTSHSDALTVVGDDDQSIYAWRGARPENLSQLQTDYPRLKVVKLEQNYRSTGTILKSANHLIANNPHVFDKVLWSQLGPGDPIKILTASDEEDEAERVANLINHRKILRRASYGEFAVLYRSNHQSRIFERALRELNIPYQLTGGTSFFDYAEVKDIIAYLRVLTNPDDDAAYLRIINTPRREIGASTVEQLATYASRRGVALCAASLELGLAEHLSSRAVKHVSSFADWLAQISRKVDDDTPADLVRTIIRDIDYPGWLAILYGDERAAERRMKQVYELVDWLEHMSGQSPKKSGQLAELVAKLTLMDILDRQNANDPGDKVQLMTLHAAKGLEFPHVFLVGMEENLLPHRNSIDSGTIDEERRLCYVGITRAQQSLTLTLASKRKRYKEMDSCVPSRFLEELPQDCVQWETKSGEQVTVSKEQGRENFANLRRLLQQSE